MTLQEQIKQHITRFLDNQRYHYAPQPEKGCIRLKVEHFMHSCIVKVYSTGSILVQGPNSPLKQELEALKLLIQEDAKESVTHSYRNLSNEQQRAVDQLLVAGPWSCENLPTKSDYQSAVYRLGHGADSLKLTQYTSGTLSLQGRNNPIFHQCCEHIEQVLGMDRGVVASRYIAAAGVKEALAPTPNSVETIEREIRQLLGDAYDYLSESNKQWMISSLFMIAGNGVFPDYGCVVMPACIAFIGFTKKLACDLMLACDHDNIAQVMVALADVHQPGYRGLVSKHPQVADNLAKLHRKLQDYRSYLSPDLNSYSSRLLSMAEAEADVKLIATTIRESFEFFRPHFTVRAFRL